MGVDIDETICVQGIIYNSKGCPIVEEDCSLDSETFEVNCGILYIKAGACQNKEEC
jgi:hypothetical protein